MAVAEINAITGEPAMRGTAKRVAIVGAVVLLEPARLVTLAEVFMAVFGWS